MKPEAKAAREALNRIGTTTEVARRLEVTPNVVTNWKRRGIPARWAQRIARIVKMKPEEVCPALERA